jgi:hypothetical protein
MVENRPFNNLLPHLILWIGIVIVAFPVYLAFVGSTHEAAVIANGQMPLTPGGKFLENYYRTIFVGTSSTTREPVASMLINSLVMAMSIALGKIFISILSAYAIVYFKFPLRSERVLDHLHHADAPGRGAHLSDLQDRRRSQPARHLCGADLAIGGLRDRDAAVPPVLHDGAGRAGRSLAHRRRRAVPLLLRYAAAAVAHQHGGAVRDPVHLRLEPVSLAAC